MKTENKTKPAFPTNARMHSDAQGITKREYFAAIAMQGILANQNWHMSEAYAAGSAIAEADELLKQLES